MWRVTHTNLDYVVQKAATDKMWVLFNMEIIVSASVLGLVSKARTVFYVSSEKRGLPKITQAWSQYLPVLRFAERRARATQLQTYHGMWPWAL